MSEFTEHSCSPCGGQSCAVRLRTATRCGYLLIGHGTRSQQGTDEFLQLAHTLRTLLSPAAVEACFLELQSPTIGEAWQRLLIAGADAVCALPLLLFAAGHAKQDIPDALRAACAASRSKGANVCFRQTPPLECHPKLLELSARRARQAIDSADGIELSRTALVMVGRGSLDSEATAEMYRFSELRGQAMRPAVIRTGFVAMANPKLPSLLEEIGRLSEIDTVVVQPHLLFQGDLNLRIDRMVDDAAAQFPDRRWIKVDRLGPDQQLAEALIDLSQSP